MMNYILDYLEDKGISVNSMEEERSLEKGIAMYLMENGIALDETRPYFVRYLNSHLSLIDDKDLKVYFVEYPVISCVKQIAIEQEQDGHVEKQRIIELYDHMKRLNEAGLSDKYIPAVQIKEILGKHS